jgi:hypothetical protein
MRRKVQGRVRLTNNDRWFFVQLYRWFPSILHALTVIRPETLVRWVPKTSSKTPELAGLRWLAWRRLVSSSSPSAIIPSRTALSRDFVARKREEFATS